MSINTDTPVGEPLLISIGGEQQSLKRVDGEYDYENGDRCHCPVCHGVGYPWGGLFHCDDAPHLAIIETGQCFVIEHGSFS